MEFSLGIENRNKYPTVALFVDKDNSMHFEHHEYSMKGV